MLKTFEYTVWWQEISTFYVIKAQSIGKTLLGRRKAHIIFIIYYLLTYFSYFIDQIFNYYIILLKNLPKIKLTKCSPEMIFLLPSNYLSTIQFILSWIVLVDLCEAYHHDLEYDRHQPLLFKLFNKPPILIQEGQQQLQPIAGEGLLVQQNLLKPDKGQRWFSIKIR